MRVRMLQVDSVTELASTEDCPGFHLKEDGCPDGPVLLVTFSKVCFQRRVCLLTCTRACHCRG